MTISQWGHLALCQTFFGFTPANSTDMSKNPSLSSAHRVMWCSQEIQFDILYISHGKEAQWYRKKALGLIALLLLMITEVHTEIAVNWGLTDCLFKKSTTVHTAALISSASILGNATVALTAVLKWCWRCLKPVASHCPRVAVYRVTSQTTQVRIEHYPKGWNSFPSDCHRPPSFHNHQSKKKKNPARHLVRHLLLQLLSGGLFFMFFFFSCFLEWSVDWFTFDS